MKCSPNKIKLNLGSSMADIVFDPEVEPSSTLLLCDETKDFCFDDLNVDHDGDQSPSWFNNASGSEPLIHLPALSEEGFASMVERETDYLPKQDYLSRLRCGELNLGARKEAFDWISKAHTYYSFGPLSLCLAVNYLDRFLSICELPRGKDWAVQLLAVACLSIAAKVEETSVPQSIELQVGDPKFMFEAKTIQRMELLVLDTLNWKMNPVTPCSFLDYSLKKLSDSHNNNNNNKSLSNITKVVNKSMQLILCTFRGIDFLEFKPSEIAAAVAMFVSAELQAVDSDKAISCLSHLEKDRVLKCIEMIKGMSNANKRSTSTRQGEVGHSPDGVLDNAACFSFKSDDLTAKTTRVESCPNICSHLTTSTVSSSGSPETKRQRL